MAIHNSLELRTLQFFQEKQTQLFIIPFLFFKQTNSFPSSGPLKTLLGCSLPGALHGAPSPPWVPTQRSLPSRVFGPLQLRLPSQPSSLQLLFLTPSCSFFSWYLYASSIECKTHSGNDLYCLHSCVPST